MDRLTSSTVLHIDATVIAGLLVLLTLQSLSANTIVSEVLTVDDELFQKHAEQRQYNSALSERLNVFQTINKNDTARIDHVQAQIDDLQVKLVMVNEEIAGLEGRHYQMTNISSQVKAVEFVKTVRLVYLGIITPFAISAMIEIISATDSRFTNKEGATNGGKYFMIAGFFFLITGLLYIFSTIAY